MDILLILGAVLIGSFIVGGDEDVDDIPDPVMPDGAGPGDDLIRGGFADDVLSGFGGNDRIDGLDGDDRLFGGLGDDWLYGGAGADDLQAGRGDDSLIGGTGADTLNGGFGDDTLFGGTAADPADADADVLLGGAGRDALFLGPQDVAAGGEGADHFSVMTTMGGAGCPTITDFDPSADGLHLLPHDDSLTADLIVGRYTDDGLLVVDRRDGSPVVLLSGVDPNAGPVTLRVGESEVGTLSSGLGTGGADRLALGGVPQIHGLSGDDIITAGPGVQQVWGDWGDDMIAGPSDGTVYGGAGDDTIDGAGEAYGGLGNDRINLDGDCGPSLFGGVGRDTIGLDFETVATGGAGIDTFRVLGDDTAPGRAIVTDFTPDQDRIEIAVSAAADLTGVTAAYTSGGYLIILDDDRSILLAGLVPADGAIVVATSIGGVSGVLSP